MVAKKGGGKGMVDRKRENKRIEMENMVGKRRENERKEKDKGK
jgi:hypothetical protein